MKDIKILEIINKDIIITDPCYIIKKDKNDDWERCKYGENMEVLGIENYLCENTRYGDWSCTTFKKETCNKLGEFCADAGLVAVFILDEVLAYNPEFDYHIKQPYTTTLIKNFTGKVKIIYNQEENEVQVKGLGSTNFFTTQTNF